MKINIDGLLYIFCILQEKDTSVHHLVWLENADTLTIKYKIVNLLPVKGEFIKVIELLIIKLEHTFFFQWYLSVLFSSAPI